MNISRLQERLFDKGKQLGFSDMEIYYFSGKSTGVKVWDKEIRGYEIREQRGVAFRGIFNDRMGYSYTEKLDDESADFLVKEAVENSKALETNEIEELFEGAAQYEELDDYSKALAELSPEAMILSAFELENIVFEADSRVQKVIESSVSNAYGETAIINTKGLNCCSKYASASGGIYVMASDGKQTATGFEYDFTLQDFSRLNFREIGQKAVREAVSKLGAAPVESGNYPVIFRNDTATQLLGAFVSNISGEAVEKGLSKLQGRLGEQIAGSNVTIIEDPLMKNVPGRAAFDGEGYPTRRLELVKEGRLMTFMHNSKTARKAGALSTGNARKNGYRSIVNVGPHNVYLEPGGLSLEAMIEKMQNGILIVELQGTNAGINFVSGDFSLYAIGHLIEDGKPVRPIDQITVSGNIFEILSRIEEIGGDLRIRGAVTAPSVKVGALTISGR